MAPPLSGVCLRQELSTPAASKSKAVAREIDALCPFVCQMDGRYVVQLWIWSPAATGELTTCKFTMTSGCAVPFLGFKSDLRRRFDVGLDWVG